MRKIEIVEQLVSTTTLTKSQAGEAVEGVFNALSHALTHGESIYVRGFATFKACTSKQKNARDIRRGTIVTVPARKTAKLIISKQLKNQMNQYE